MDIYIEKCYFVLIIDCNIFLKNIAFSKKKEFYTFIVLIKFYILKDSYVFFIIFSYKIDICILSINIFNGFLNTGE